LAFNAMPAAASSKAADPAATILGRELADALRQAVDELPASQRLALYLCTHQAMSYEDIARVMGKSLADVKVTIHRGRKRVQEQLNKYLKDEM
jgi:RNA polymerase sigma-70 factor (ECF subfamily)